MVRKKENYRLFTEEISLFIEVCLRKQIFSLPLQAKSKMIEHHLSKMRLYIHLTKIQNKTRDKSKSIDYKF